MEKNSFRGGVVKLLLGIEITTLFLGIKSFGNKNNTLDDIKLLDSKSDNLFAIMVKDSSGNYNESSTFPTGAYILNETLSSCVDNNGNKIDNALSYESGHVYTRTNKTVYCYLYFDEDLLKVYDKVIEDYNNNVQVAKTTDEDGNDVYYYTGSDEDTYYVDLNNIVFNNFCWRMVRTTETDGVKILYNGVYKEDTKCNNEDTNTLIDSNGTAFNLKEDSLAYVGYMYGTVYTNSLSRGEGGSSSGSGGGSSSGSGGGSSSSRTMYYYGSDVTWDGTTYTLNDAESLSSPTAYKHYTCLSTSTSCKSVYYYHSRELGRGDLLYITLTSGKKIENALDEMLNYNTTNSNIKTVIDNWYKNNMTNVTDYIENAIYCNNRNISNLGGFNPSGGNLTTPLQFNDYDERNARLTCQDKEDQFTLKVDSGGTLGYGNNALDYPVGLLTAKEISLVKYRSTINPSNAITILTLSPYGLSQYNDGYYVNVFYNQSIRGDRIATTFGVKPVITLKKDVRISSGSGSDSDPYITKIN